MKKNRILLVMAAMLALFIVVGCAGQQFKTNSYKTLAAGAAIYESGYPAFLELHQKGIISAEAKARGKALATKYWAAYHASTNALIAYDAVATAENKDRVNVALQEVQRCLADLASYIQPFLTKGV